MGRELVGDGAEIKGLYPTFIVADVCLNLAASPFYTLFKDLFPLATALPLAVPPTYFDSPYVIPEKPTKALEST
jgi:hypothetical protein